MKTLKEYLNRLEELKTALTKETAKSCPNYDTIRQLQQNIELIDDYIYRKTK